MKDYHFNPIKKVMLISHPLSYAKVILLLFFICSGFLANSAIADTYPGLMEKYYDIEDSLLQNSYDAPMYLESNSIKNTMSGDIFGILYHPFKTVSNTLKSLESWCAIMPQHLNIKACTYQYENSTCKLTFYSGRKYYQKADDVYRLNYIFNITSLSNKHLKISLKAKEGPLDTTNYIIQVEAIPLTDTSTFIHLSYEYSYGLWARIGMSTYLVTLGNDKVGFTIQKKDKNNKPVYIKGTRGIIERNAMRYYFAIQSHLNSLSTPLYKRLETKLNYWFDLTEKHSKQLYEMDKNDYLKYKKMEHQDQIRLQKNINDMSKATNDPNTSNFVCVSNE